LSIQTVAMASLPRPLRALAAMLLASLYTLLITYKLILISYIFLLQLAIKRILYILS